MCVCVPGRLGPVQVLKNMNSVPIIRQHDYKAYYKHIYVHTKKSSNEVRNTPLPLVPLPSTLPKCQKTSTKFKDPFSDTLNVMAAYTSLLRVASGGHQALKFF